MSNPGLAALAGSRAERSIRFMWLIQKVRDRLKRKSATRSSEAELPEFKVIARGWDQYAAQWDREKVACGPGHQVRFLGDEWTGTGGAGYGLPADVTLLLEDYLEEKLVQPYLPPNSNEGLEIGPGGGRLTVKLLPRTRTLHVVDASEEMLQHLRHRFRDVTTLRYHLADGMTLPPLRPAGLDYVVAFDVFVHFEPRLIYWYLRQIGHLLRPGGVGIIHYANVLTREGWEQFEADLEGNVSGRRRFEAFGVMCPPLMERFLKMQAFDVIAADVAVIPRDAVAVFKKPAQRSGGA